MSEPKREMFSEELVEAMERLHSYPRLIAERAAREAVTAERARLAVAVRALRTDRGGNYLDGWEDFQAAILAALLEPTDA